jgi:protein involved in polysaccharide export with SLBB domain
VGNEALVTKRLAFSVAGSSGGDCSVMERSRRNAWARFTIWISFLLLAPSGALAAQNGGRVLTASDVVAIRIVDHPDLDTTTRVEPDGTINFPYVGRIKAAGRTEDDLGRAVERRLIELKIIAGP